tara:strand:+ start:353 stop:571 length:219 start_codon:yes stop_codon:yes gene_type:complete
MKTHNITKDIYNFTGSDLKNLRKEIYLSQHEMSNLLGFTSRSYCSHLEKRKVLPKHIALLCALIKEYCIIDS